MVASYILLLYTEFVPDAEVRYQIGWFHVAVLGFLLLFNIMFIMCSESKTCKMKYIKFSVKRKFKKNLKKKFEEMRVKREQEKIRRDKILSIFSIPELEEKEDGDRKPKIEISLDTVKEEDSVDADKMSPEKKVPPEIENLNDS